MRIPLVVGFYRQRVQWSPSFWTHSTRSTASLLARGLLNEQKSNTKWRQSTFRHCRIKAMELKPPATGDGALFFSNKGVDPHLLNIILTVGHLLQVARRLRVRISQLIRLVEWKLDINNNVIRLAFFPRSCKSTLFEAESQLARKRCVLFQLDFSNGIQIYTPSPKRCEWTQSWKIFQCPNPNITRDWSSNQGGAGGGKQRTGYLAS